MISRTPIIFLGALAILATGCKSKSDAKLDEINKRLTAIEEKLDALASGGGGGEGPPGPKPGVVYKVPVDAQDASRGGPHAKVTVVEAFEFACPYCAMVAPTLDGLLEKYKPEEVRVVQKHMIVHPDMATDAAHSACAAHRQGKFGDFEKKLWTNAWGDLKDPNFNGDKLSATALRDLAKEVGMDLSKYDEDIKGPCPELVTRNQTELGNLGVQGTPTLFVNGMAYNGPRTIDGFAKVIDAEIAKADEAIKNGTKLEDYYQTLIKDAPEKF